MLPRGKAGSSVGAGFCSGLSTSPWLPKGWPRLRSIWTGPLRVACALKKKENIYIDIDIDIDIDI